MDGTSHQNDKFIRLKSIKTNDGSIVELPTKQFRVQMFSKPKSDPKTHLEKGHNPEVPDLVKIRPPTKNMVHLSSLPNGDNNKNRILYKHAVITKLPCKDSSIPTMPRLIPVKSTPRFDGQKLLMKTSDGKQIIVKSQGPSAHALISVPALTALPRRVTKPRPQPLKLHITGSDSDEMDTDSENDVTEPIKEVEKIVSIVKEVSPRPTISSPIDRHGISNGKLELQQVKRTYGRNIYPPKNTNNTVEISSILENTLDSKSSPDYTCEDNDFNSNDSEVFQGFLNEKSSPDIETQLKKIAEAEVKKNSSGLFCGYNSELARNQTNLKDTNPHKSHASINKNVFRPSSPQIVNKRLNIFKNKGQRNRSQSLFITRPFENHLANNKLSTSAEIVKVPPGWKLKVSPQLQQPSVKTEPSEEMMETVVELMCDEKIEDNTPENSPENKEQPLPEVHPTLVENLKKNLSRKLSEAKQPEEPSALQPDYDDFLDKSEIQKQPTDGKKEKVLKKSKVDPKSKRNKNVEDENSNRPISSLEDKTQVRTKAYKLENIKFVAGVGSLQDCRKRFNFNEFGLLEIYTGPQLSSDLPVDKHLQLTFSQQMGVSSSPLVVCRVCKKTGSTQGFLKEDCCSFICQTIANASSRKKGSSSGSQTPPSRNSPLVQVKCSNEQQQQNEQLMQQLRGLMHTNNAELEDVNDNKTFMELEHNQSILKQIFQKQQEKKRKLVETEGPVDEKNFSADDHNTCPAEQGISGTNRYYQAGKDTSFRWDLYLSNRNIPAPLGLFINPYPSTSNLFEVGMRLEAIDPQNQSLFCVVSVDQKTGFRLKLHFEGYSHAFDFWVNADSLDIFPPGWCKNTGRALQAPPSYRDGFDWEEYLEQHDAIGAPKSLFMHLNPTSTHNNFERNMKLLVQDRKTRKYHIATIIDVLDNRILVHYDEMHEQYSYWIEINSPRISPINAQIDTNGIVMPTSCGNRPFNWAQYMRSSGGRFAPSTNFCKRLPFEFTSGMKLEIVDKANPKLIRPATVLKCIDYQLLIVYDGFEIFFSHWVDDDSVDIHPINWCDKTNHPIEHPAGFGQQNGLCSVLGCQGIGNALNSSKYFHDCIADCPYLKQNWMDYQDQQPTRVLTNEIQQFNSACSSNNNNISQNVALNNVPLKSKLIGRPRAVSKAGSKKNREQVNKADISDDNLINDQSKIQRKQQNKRSSASAANSEQDEPKLKRRKLPNYVLTTAVRIDTSKDHLSEYGPQLRYAQKLWTSHSKILQRTTDENNRITKNPLYWTVNDVSNYVARLPNCTNCAQAFHTSMIDGQAFLMLGQDDLIKELNIKFGPAVKIYNRIVFLREEIILNYLKV